MNNWVLDNEDDVTFTLIVATLCVGFITITIVEELRISKKIFMSIKLRVAK